MKLHCPSCNKLVEVISQPNDDPACTQCQKKISMNNILSALENPTAPVKQEKSDTSSWIIPLLVCAGAVLLRGLRDGDLVGHIVFALLGGLLALALVAAYLFLFRR